MRKTKEEKKEKTEIIKTEGQAEIEPASTIAITKAPIEYVDEAEVSRRIEEIKKRKLLVMRLTKPEDWIDIDGEPYLEISGARKVADAFQISWKFKGREIIKKENGYSVVITEGIFSRYGRSIEEVGAISTDNPSICLRHNVKLPPEEVDISLAIKRSATNCIHRGIFAILGIGGLTWDELEKIGIKRTEKGYSFKKKEEKEPQKEESQVEVEITEGVKASSSAIDYVKIQAKRKGFSEEELENAIGKKFQDWTTDDVNKALAYIRKKEVEK